MLTYYTILESCSMEVDGKYGPFLTYPTYLYCPGKLSLSSLIKHSTKLYDQFFKFYLHNIQFNQIIFFYQYGIQYQQMYFLL